MVEDTGMNNDLPAPLCSVCIANYNGEQVLADCIDSVLAQQGDARLEIIIHDDASSDGSLQLLQSRYPRDLYPQIQLIVSQENVGFCISNNRMVDVARGHYVLLLNNDAALAPDAIQSLLAASRAQPREGILTLPQLDWQSGELVDRGCLLDPFYNPIPNLDPAQRDVAMVIGACLWLPRELWQALGGFPAWFESIAEDMYLCCRARLAGYPVQVTPGSFYRHRQGASFGGNRVANNRLASTYRRRRLSERNKSYVLAICSPPLQLWLSLPLHLLLLSLEGLLLSLLKGEARIWREIYRNALLSLLHERPRLLAERRAAQASRDSSRGYAAAFRLLPRKLAMLLRHGLPGLR